MRKSCAEASNAARATMADVSMARDTGNDAAHGGEPTPTQARRELRLARNLISKRKRAGRNGVCIRGADHGCADGERPRRRTPLLRLELDATARDLLRPNE
jgi:hypothetical protein